MPLNSRYKSIIELGLLLGLAILMAIALSVGITIFLGGSSHPTVAVTTGSMLPIYNGFQDDVKTEIYPFRGDILLVKKIPIESIEIGDVIVFDTPSVSDPVVHRVVAKWREDDIFFFKTNGDNNPSVDPWEVSGDEIHGVVVLRIPHIGWFLLVVQTTLGKIFILALAVLILFIGDDSKEDIPSTEKDQIIIDDQNSNNMISKTKHIGKKIVKKKSYLYTLLTIIILILFLGSNLFSSFFYPPSVKLYRIDDESHVANLIVSPSPLSSRNGWEEYPNQTLYFFPIQIEIKSGGIFNNIDRIEIHVNETKGFYGWNIVYNFVGTRIFKGGIVAVMNSSTTATALVSVSVYSRGLFASTPQFITFSISLRSQK